MTATQSKPVVVCADDYALNAPTSQGIVALARLNRLSATSVMSLSPRWAEDAPALREVRERLDVGLHLDWTSSFALAAGHGSRLSWVMLRSLLHAYRPRQLQDIMARQLDAFELHWQAPPDHVDGHQHIHQFPVVREALTRVLMRRYGAQATRPWLRISQVAQEGLKAKVISHMGAQALQAWAQAQRWPSVSPLLGAYDFDGDASDYARRMQHWLAQLSRDRPSVLMCHPAVSAQADDAIGPARTREFAYLASAHFVRDLRLAQAQLVRGHGQTMTQPDDCF